MRLFFPLLLLLFTLASCRKAPETGRRMGGPVPVLVAPVEKQDVPLTLAAIGRVVPIASVAIKPQVTGQISEVHFTEGQEVKVGDLLFTLDKRPFEAALHQAQASLDQAQANLRNAQRQAERYTALSNRGAVAKEQSDQVHLTLETSSAAVAAAEAEVETARLRLGYCSIASPLNGRTGRRLVDPGNVVSANASDLVVINQMEPIHVTFPVAERYLSELTRYLGEGGVFARVTPEGGTPSEGPVHFLDNAVKPGSGTIELKATIPNEARHLWPGQFVQVEATLTTTRGATVIPANAVQSGQKGDYVFLVGPEGKAEYRAITLERVAHGLALIRSGVAPGETVVTDGQGRLTNGTPVEIKPGLSAAPQP